MLKEIPDFEGYYADENGYIWSNLGRGNRNHAKRTDFYKLTERPTKTGYLRVRMRQVSSGKRKDLYIHRIIAQLFCDNPNNLPEVNHKDTNVKNNAASNLEWITHKDNLLYAEIHGNKTRDNLGRFAAKQ